MPFGPRTLGSTGIQVGPMGLAASYGAPASTVPWAFDLGVRYFYWGSMRRGKFAHGLRELAPQRDRYSLVIQSFSRVATLIPWSLQIALRRLRTDYADVLLLGLWNQSPPPRRIVDACLELKHRGLIRWLALSTHQRPMIPELAASSPYDIFHVRYNAIHRGAEREVFPRMPQVNAPGLVAFTATSWKQLLDPAKMPAGERTPTAADCYRFVLTNPAVDLCMAGPANIEQSKAIETAIVKGPMNEDELAWMRRVGDALYRGKDRAAGAAR